MEAGTHIVVILLEEIDKTMLEKDQPSYKQQILCPWWFCFSFDNIFRRLVQNPEKILEPYIKSGWTLLDVGPGMGYFTIPLARLVGYTGKIIAVDLQRQMLNGIQRRALRARVQDRIVLHQSAPESIGVKEPIDFCLCFWMLHEVSDRARFLGEIFALLKPGGLLLLVEPKIHVSLSSFKISVDISNKVGFTEIHKPSIFLSYAALLKK